ncbi:MAG: hypothetical protein N2Z21_04565, partial [Candidatus Sumerlaeaceae bacterium]|nr:hypothetical protein [Candidatus Sumerlaeaceae bacterium]
RRARCVEIPEPLRGLLGAKSFPSLEQFLAVTDDTIFYALNLWRDCADPVLSTLARGLLHRELFKTLDVSHSRNLRKKVAAARRLLAEKGVDPNYFFMIYESKNLAYQPYVSKGKRAHHHIFVQLRDRRNTCADIATVSPLVAGLARATAFVRRVIFPERVMGQYVRPELESIFDR